MSKHDPQMTLPRYSLEDCELLPRKNGSICMVADVVEMLRDIGDDDHQEVMFEKIIKRLEELHV